MYVEPESVTSVCVGEGEHKHIYAVTMCENTHLFSTDSDYACPIYNIRGSDGAVNRPRCPTAMNFMSSSLDVLMFNMRVHEGTQTESSNLHYADLQNLPSTSRGVSDRQNIGSVESHTARKVPYEDVRANTRISHDRFCLPTVTNQRALIDLTARTMSNPLYDTSLTDDQAMIFRTTREVPSNIQNFTQALYMFVYLRLKRFIQRSADRGDAYFDDFVYKCFAAILNGDFSLLTALLEM